MTNVSPVTTFSSQSSTAQLVTISQGSISLLTQTDSMSHGYSSQEPLPALMTRDQMMSSTILPHPSPRDQMLSSQGNGRPQLMAVNNRKDEMMSPPTSRGMWSIPIILITNYCLFTALLSPPVSRQLLSPLLSPHDVIISSPPQISSLSGKERTRSPLASLHPSIV